MEDGLKKDLLNLYMVKLLDMFGSQVKKNVEDIINCKRNIEWYDNGVIVWDIEGSTLKADPFRKEGSKPGEWFIRIYGHFEEIAKREGCNRIRITTENRKVCDICVRRYKFKLIGQKTDGILTADILEKEVEPWGI